MKVLQINSVCGYGSTGRIATDLYEIIEKEGHEACIAYGRGVAPEKYKTIKIGNRKDLFFHLCKSRLFDKHGLGSKKATLKFIEKIKEYNPDVIHLHNLHGYYLNIELFFLYLSKLNIPIIWLLHDAWALSGHSAHFELDSNGEIPKKNIKKNQHKEYPKSFFVDNSKKNYLLKKEIFTKVNDMTIVTPSHWLAKLVNKSFLNKYDVKVIHNGIDLNKFKVVNSNFTQKNKLEGKKIILGVASIWTEKKGFYVFNKLASMLDDSYKIVVVGKVDKEIREKSNEILYLERTNNIEELVDIYNAATLFINPTFEDNFPTTNLESLACGTPVITFDTGGSSESLTEETGIIIKKGDIKKLVSAIENFSDSDDIKQICRKQAINFNKEKLYTEYISLYNSKNLKS